MKLSSIRRILALIFISAFLLFFLDYSGKIPFGFKHLAQFQWMPALLAGNLLIITILTLLTLCWGRVYCSILCPLGIFQDLIHRLAKKTKKRQQYLQEHRILRNTILIVCALAMFMGWGALFSLIDPYSIFGRTATHLFRPIFLWGNNLLAAILTKNGSYALYHVQLIFAGTFTMLITSASIIIIAILAYRSGRLYCNTICPVGTFLGWISKYSLFKICMNQDACNSCGKCERNCKSACIDSKNKIIDQSRCVECLNCLDHCSKGAMHYSFTYGRKKTKKADSRPQAATAPAPATATATASAPAKTVPANHNTRRRFFGTLTFLSVSIPLAKANKILRRSTKRSIAIAPPGAKSHLHLHQNCTACHLCIAKCPNDIIQPAFLEYGLNGMLHPVLNFDKGFCNYDCTICAQVCPSNALSPITKEQKHLLQVGRVKLDLEKCVVKTDLTNCGACSEHCPTQAVEMIPYQGALTIPRIHPELCVGCGGCEFICPVQPQTAIYVEGLTKHQLAKAITKDVQKKVESIDFGF